MYYVLLCHYIRILYQRTAQALSTVNMAVVRGRTINFAKFYYPTYETSVPTQHTTLLHNPGRQYSMCW